MIAFTLIYYSVAWAILRCNHDDASMDLAIVTEVNNSQVLAHGHITLPGESESIDCMDFDYHAEFLGAPTAPPQVHRSLLSPGLHHYDLVPSVNLYHAHGVDSRANVTRGSPGVEFIDAPLYLFISSLRI